MRGFAALAFGLGVFVSQPALALQQIDCESSPSDSRSFTLDPAGGMVGFGLHSSAETGITLTATGNGNLSFSLDGTVIRSVTGGTHSVHISTVFASPDYGYVVFTSDQAATYTAVCTANPTAAPISQLEGQTLFQQGNFVSSSASFQSLLSGDDPFAGGDGTGEPLAFSPDQARATEALRAIDGTFALFGYGPSGTLAGDALLAVGEDWFVKGFVKGTISETDVSGGKLTELGGTASIMAQRNLPDGLKLALAATGGIGHAMAPGQSDDNRSFGIDGAVSMPLTDALALIAGANWGVSTHDVDLGSATGSYTEQMVSGSVTLRGREVFGALTVTPALTGNLGYGWQPDFTDSAATAHAGGNAFAASVDAGLTLAYDLPATGDTQLTPFAGVTASAYHQSYAENGGATSASNDLGGEVALGLKARFGEASAASVKTTLARRGSSTSASLSGSLSSRF